MLKNDVSVFVIMDGCEYVTDDEYTGGCDGTACQEHPRFIMLTNDALNPEYGDDNSIVIPVDSDIWERIDGINNDGGLQWYDKEIGPVKVRHDEQTLRLVERDGHFIPLDGYAQSNSLLSQNAGRNDIVLRRVFAMTVDYDGATLHGFLPSIGQIHLIDMYLKRILALMEISRTHVGSLRIYKDESDFMADGHISGAWWTSTVFSGEVMWKCETWSLSLGGGTRKCRVLPLYRLKK